MSNTSPILNLAIVDQLVLLRRQFSEIQIPNSVLDELKVATLLGHIEDELLRLGNRN